MSAPAVELIGAVKRFGRRARLSRANGAPPPGVGPIDLVVGRGEAWLLAGPNGAGKTTLLELVAGLLLPDAGEVRTLGGPPRAQRHRLGLQPEVFFAEPDLRVGELLEVHAGLAGLVGEARRRAARAAADAWGLADARRRRLGGLSKGTTHRLSLAQAQLAAPELVLLDEPTSGLDPQVRRQVLSRIAALRQQGSAVLLSTHVLAEVEDICDHVAVIADGRCLVSGPRAALTAAGGHASLEALYLATLERAAPRPAAG